jgi:hypothetical protein
MSMCGLLCIGSWILGGGGAQNFGFLLGRQASAQPLSIYSA